MGLKKNFLHKEPDFFPIPRVEIVIGIIVGLLFAYTFYSFLYFSRELLRIFSVLDTYGLWILSDKEVYFYNLIFAYIAVIIGQSVTFSFWFERPKRIFKQQNYRRQAILNDQRALNWFFLSWFGRVATIFALILGINGGFYVFNLYPDYNWVFILLVIVLFLQTWNTINRAFKRKGQKWMLCSALLVSLVAFGFSRINLVDYKAINQIYLNKNIHYNYNLELPETNSYEYLFGTISDIYIVESDTEQAQSKPLIIANNEIIPIDELYDKIMEWKSGKDKYSSDRTIYRLHIHKSIKMEFVNQVKNELSKLGFSNIAYAVVPTHHEYDQRYYKHCSFPMVLPNWNEENSDPKVISENLNQFPNRIEINHTESDYLVNDTLVLKEQLKSKFKGLIQQNPDYIVILYKDDKATFADYFKVLSSLKEAANELRNEYSEEEYSKEYNLLDYKQAVEIKRRFPFRISEIVEEK